MIENLHEAKRIIDEIIDYCDENLHTPMPCPEMCHKCDMLRHLKRQAEQAMEQVNAAIDNASRYTVSSGTGYPNPARVSSIPPDER